VPEDPIGMEKDGHAACHRHGQSPGRCDIRCLGRPLPDNKTSHLEGGAEAAERTMVGRVDAGPGDRSGGGEEEGPAVSLIGPSIVW
jgi:hypothetical protein